MCRHYRRRLRGRGLNSCALIVRVLLVVVVVVRGFVGRTGCPNLLLTKIGPSSAAVSHVESFGVGVVFPSPGWSSSLPTHFLLV